VLKETAVTVDKDKVANVLYHLISNAQQATADDGEVDVVITGNSDNKTQLVQVWIKRLLKSDYSSHLIPRKAMLVWGLVHMMQKHISSLSVAN